MCGWVGGGGRGGGGRGMCGFVFSRYHASCDGLDKISLKKMKQLKKVRSPLFPFLSRPGSAFSRLYLLSLAAALLDLLF